jgi:transcriptional regulator with XRE-family HTH domain
VAKGEATRIAVVVGRNLRRIREEGPPGIEGRLNQDMTATLLAAYGLDWTASQLAKVERGERHDITINELALIATALGVHPGELLRCDPGERVALSEDATCDGTFLPLILTLGPEERGLAQPPHFESPITRQASTPFTTSSGATASVTVFWRPTEAEEQFASKLGTTPLIVNQVAGQLWDNTVTEERERRLTERLVAATGEPDQEERNVSVMRGHVTRQLVAELRPAVEQHLAETKKAKRTGASKKGRKR